MKISVAVAKVRHTTFQFETEALVLVGGRSVALLRGLPAVVEDPSLTRSAEPQLSTDTDCIDEAAFVQVPERGNRLLSPGLLAPLALPLPDLRPGTTSAAATGASPPVDGFFDPLAAYSGAVLPARTPAGNIPWYAGWTDHW